MYTFPEFVWPIEIISLECKFAKIFIGLFVRKSENINLFSYEDTVKNVLFTVKST